MRIPAEKMKHILRPGVKILSDMFSRNNFEIRVAGGAVRDLLMDKIPTDLDFATTATPTEMKKMFQKEEVRLLNLVAGEKHGTITARIEEENFECTTLRIDKTTDGRHAEVEFIRDWELDAGRRDLTINAMFLGMDGTIYDYFDGVKHVQDRIVKFVGDPDLRIQEDYLRILRYFRFFGRIANDPTKHDPDVLSAIQRNCEGLARISGERIWVEFKKIITGRYCCELLRKMMECGVAVHIGLPEDFNCEDVRKFHSRLAVKEIHPCTLLAAGMENEEQAFVLINRVKCSNKEKEALLFIIKQRELLPGQNERLVKFIQDLLVDMVYREKKPELLCLFGVTELLKYVGRDDLLPEINKEFIPKFPIRGGNLVGIIEKKRISIEVRRLLDLWKESNYTLSKEDLLNKVT